MKTLTEIVQDLLDNKEIKPTETDFLKKNLMNEPSLYLFDLLLQKAPDKIPSTCVRYMLNYESANKFKTYIDDFKTISLNKGYHFSPLKKVKKGIFKNDLISDYDKAIVAFFSTISFYSIEGYSEGVLSNILKIQCENPKIKITDEVIECACQGMTGKKINGESLSEFIHLIHETTMSDYLIDRFLTSFANSTEYVISKMTSASLSDLCKISSKLYREYYNRNSQSFHHKVKSKINRLEKLDIKIRKSVSEELSKRPDSHLTYLLV